MGSDVNDCGFWGVHREYRGEDGSYDTQEDTRSTVACLAMKRFCNETESLNAAPQKWPSHLSSLLILGPHPSLVLSLWHVSFLKLPSVVMGSLDGSHPLDRLIDSVQGAEMEFPTPAFLPPLPIQINWRREKYTLPLLPSTLFTTDSAEITPEVLRTWLLLPPVVLLG